jgi:cytochrome c551/c552
MKWWKLVLAFVVGFLIAAQFIRPNFANPPIDPAKTILARTPVPPNVEKMFERACYDCHSNSTVLPWYSKVAPVSWWLASHIHDGRKEVNFSEWETYPQKRKLRKLKDICEQVREGDMPMKVYVPMHPKARLSDADRAAICAWAKAESARLGAPAPAPPKPQAHS